MYTKNDRRLAVLLYWGGINALCDGSSCRMMTNFVCSHFFPLQRFQFQQKVILRGKYVRYLYISSGRTGAQFIRSILDKFLQAWSFLYKCVANFRLTTELVQDVFSEITPSVKMLGEENIKYSMFDSVRVCSSLDRFWADAGQHCPGLLCRKVHGPSLNQGATKTQRVIPPLVSQPSDVLVLIFDARSSYR